jgi:hypothetical protein
MMEIVGLPLSLIAIAVFVALLLDWRRRRGRFEPVHVAGNRLEANAVQWLWLAVIVGTFAVAMLGPAIPLASHERQMIEGQAGQGSEPAPLVRMTQRSRMGAMLPFYRYGRTVRSADGTLQSVTITRQLVLPIWFIVAAALYWLLVIKRTRRANGDTAERTASMRS